MRKTTRVDILGWKALASLFTMYLIVMATVGISTVPKGHTIPGLIGIIAPAFWLTGASLPAELESRYEVEQAARYRSGVTG